MKRLALILMAALLTVAFAAGRDWGTVKLSRIFLINHVTGDTYAYIDSTGFHGNGANLDSVGTTAVESIVGAWLNDSLRGKVDTGSAANTAPNADLLQGQDTTALWNAKTLQTKDTTYFARAAHGHTGTDITSGTVDGDRLPAMSASKLGGVPATGTPSGKFLRDDASWQTAGGAAVDQQARDTATAALRFAERDSVAAMRLIGPGTDSAGNHLVVQATRLRGALTGAVTGNVTGNLTGTADSATGAVRLAGEAATSFARVLGSGSDSLGNHLVVQATRVRGALIGNSTTTDSSTGGATRATLAANSSLLQGYDTTAFFSRMTGITAAAASETAAAHADAVRSEIRDTVLAMTGADSIVYVGTGGIDVSYANDTVTIDGSGITGGGDTMFQHVQVLTMTTHTHFDMDSGGVGTLRLTGNDTLLNPTNTHNGTSYWLNVIQDTIGSRTLTFGANHRNASGLDTTHNRMTSWHGLGLNDSLIYWTLAWAGVATPDTQARGGGGGGTPGVDTMIPSAVSSPNNWGVYPAEWPDKATAVAPPTDSLTSAISAYQNEIQRYALPAPDIPAGATVDSVCVFAQFLSGATLGIGARPGLYLDGDTTEGTEFEAAELYPVWDSAIVRVLKPGGGTFTEANLGDMELFLRRSDDEYAQLIVTTLDVLVFYREEE